VSRTGPDTTARQGLDFQILALTGTANETAAAGSQASEHPSSQGGHLTTLECSAGVFKIKALRLATKVAVTMGGQPCDYDDDDGYKWAPGPWPPVPSPDPGSGSGKGIRHPDTVPRRKVLEKEWQAELQCECLRRAGEKRQHNVATLPLMRGWHG